MKAYVYTAHGGPEVEELADVPRPEPGAGQLLIAVDAAGVNPADWKRRAGAMHSPDSPPEHFPLPFGREASGLVAAVGPRVDGFAVGDAVSGNSDGGGFSEYALLPVPVTAHRPPGLSSTDAATLPVGGAPVARARNQEVLDAVAELVADGALNPYVTRTFPLDQAADALRLVENGHVQGKVVIEVAA